MDYDATEIPVGYDRGREHGPAYHELWMNIVSSYVSDITINAILDLGCGTGRFSADLAARFDAEVIGVDPSTKMLEQARKKLRDRRVRYETGHGESIPLQDQSIDLVFMSMSYHHFDNPTVAARECLRVLREQGSVFLRAGTRERIPDYPYVAFFPETRPILEDTLVTGASIRAVFEYAGFRMVAEDVVTQEIAPNHDAYADKLSAGADSVLSQLRPIELDSGMGALRAYAERTDSQPVFEPIDIFVFRPAQELRKKM